MSTKELPIYDKLIIRAIAKSVGIGLLPTAGVIIAFVIMYVK